MKLWAAQFANYPTWNLMWWLAWAAQFAFLETLGVKSEKFAALTDLCIRALPPDVLAAFCGWLLYHFCVHYINSPATSFWR